MNDQSSAPAEATFAEKAVAWLIALAVVAVFVLGLLGVCDGTLDSRTNNPGDSRMAWLVQHTPTYAQAYWLTEPRRDANASMTMMQGFANGKWLDPISCPRKGDYYVCPPITLPSEVPSWLKK